VFLELFAGIVESAKEYPLGLQGNYPSYLPEDSSLNQSESGKLGF